MLHIGTADRAHVPLVVQVAEFFSRLVAEYRTRSEQRRVRRRFVQLAELDDRILDDIGVTRADIMEAADLPVDVNASLAVRRMMAERRQSEPQRRR